MSLLKSLIAPAATVGTICAVLASAAPSKASSWDLCLPFAGGEICADYGRHYDEVEATIPGFGTEYMTITCTNNGYDASSRGDWSREYAEAFVEGYCDGRGSHD